MTLAFFTAASSAYRRELNCVSQPSMPVTVPTMGTGIYPTPVISLIKGVYRISRDRDRGSNLYGAQRAHRCHPSQPAIAGHKVSTSESPRLASQMLTRSPPRPENDS